MNAKISKTNADLAYFNTRLDEIQLSSYERLRAKAHMARAEAFADFLARVYRAVAGLFQAASKSHGRTAPSAG